MATFEENVEKIKNAVYGKDVRNAIHDSIIQAAGINGGTSVSGAELTFDDTSNKLNIKITNSDGTTISDSAELCQFVKGISGKVVKEASSNTFRLRLTASNNSNTLSDTSTAMPFNCINIKSIGLSIGDNGQIKVQLKAEKMTDIETDGTPVMTECVFEAADTLTLPETLTNAVVGIAVKELIGDCCLEITDNFGTKTEVDLPQYEKLYQINSGNYFGLPVVKYNADSEKYISNSGTEIDISETTEFIPTVTSITELTKNAYLSKVTAGTNKILIADGDVSDILPINTWRSADAEIRQKLIGQLDGIKITGYIVDDGFLGKDSDNPAVCSVKVPVESGTYTIFYPEEGEIYNSFWNHKGNGLIVSSTEDVGDVTDVGMIEFTNNSVLYSGFSHANVLKKGIRTSGIKGYYAVITVPTGGKWVYFDSQGVFVNNALDSSLKTMHGANAVIIKGDITTTVDNALVEKYISQIGDWIISDTQAEAEILALKAKIAELESKINSLTN